jgi:acetoin utilization protein AcuB
MLVRYWMTPNPFSISTAHNLDQAYSLFKKKNVRRLVVLQNSKVKLVGILSLSDLFSYVTPRALGKAELSAKDRRALASIMVGDAMTANPHTCTIEDHIEDVGYMMRKKRVGALPVMREGKIAGIITESDVLDALTEITGRGNEGRRVCLISPLGEERGVMCEIFRLCEKYETELITVLTHPVKDRNYKLCMLRVKGDHCDQFIEALWQNRYQVLQVDSYEGGVNPVAVNRA